MHNIREEDIAIIGLAGRFPGASTIEQFWENICEGKESITHFSAEEINEVAVGSLLHHPDYVRAKGIVDNVDLFDADFFGLSELDAKLLDPQQRLFLLCACEALEDAGYPAKNPTDDRVGVFASSAMSLYLLHNILKNPEIINTVDESLILLGNDKDFLATRVSYLLNLKGPSINIQTGCSSSLVCIHYAVQSLLNGECDMALAGGVSIILPQEQGYLYRKNMMGSADGRCYPFDKQAQGSVKSNGVGVVALKLLQDAIEDNDPVYAVIRGSAVNNDGSQKAAFTASNALQQTDVIKQALRVAEVESRSIAFIETHGTGASVGDSIEIAGLKRAIKGKEKHCALASLKGNIGHLGVAAGVAGFIKTCLSLYHGKIPPSIHFSELNSEISLDKTPFYINTILQDWPDTLYPKRAGVSVFGVGGTNAHIILQEHCPSLRKVRPDSDAQQWDLKRYWIDAIQSSPTLSFTSIGTSPYDVLECLTNAWKGVLGKEPLTEEAHFFNEGGHSVSAAQFIEQLPTSLRQQVKVAHLYQFPVFKYLVQHVLSLHTEGV